jgi:hypothetical protein
MFSGRVKRHLIALSGPMTTWWRKRDLTAELTCFHPAKLFMMQ